MKSKVLFVLVGSTLLAFLINAPVDVKGALGMATATFIQVNTLGDELNTDGDCSLREAVRAANTDTAVDACPAGQGEDTILIPSGNYVLTLTGSGENEGLTGDLDLTASVRIRGAGIDATILDGNGTDRIFHVHPGVNVDLSSMTIRNGNVSDSSYFGGGGILNEGQLTLSRCRIEHNQTQGTGGIKKRGGGLENDGTATVSECTFEANSANTGGAIVNGYELTITASLLYNNRASESGGALDNYANASITNTTISMNQGGQGGGVFNDGELHLVNVTIFENTSGIENAGDLYITNSLVADSTSGENCTGSDPITSNGHNIDSGSSCNFTQLTDKVNTDVRLDLLGENGGPTRTHALLQDSPAIDAGDSSKCASTDQRGFFRPADGDHDGEPRCDIGAYEYDAILPASIYLPLVIRQ